MLFFPVLLHSVCDASESWQPSALVFNEFQSKPFETARVDRSKSKLLEVEVNISVLQTSSSLFWTLFWSLFWCSTFALSWPKPSFILNIFWGHGQNSRRRAKEGRKRWTKPMNFNRINRMSALALSQVSHVSCFPGVSQVSQGVSGSLGGFLQTQQLAT